MLRVANIRVPIDQRGQITRALCKKLGISEQELLSIKIYKESYDARKKHRNFVYSADIELKNEQSILSKNLSWVSVAKEKRYVLPQAGNEDLRNRPIVIGSGPCGLFAAYLLAKMGFRPLLLERGADVDSRTKIVTRFWSGGQLQANTNVQFGEGGAGTFSDGKLTTNIRDVRCRFVLESLVANGAPADILYSYRPHIGTDYLRLVVRNIRKQIIELGGDVRFNSLVTSLKMVNSKTVGVVVDNSEYISAQTVILAIGHSARDTYHMLYENGVNLTPKSFSIGLRIEHLQQDIDAAQYGKYAGNENLEPADYRLKYHDNGRSAYSFCMCPGGLVVASASGFAEVVTNGMSYYNRGATNANSALLVGVTPEDFCSHPLGGIYFQQRYEKLAFKLGGSNYCAPVQLLGDFMQDKPSTSFGRIKPSYLPGVRFARLSQCLPHYVVSTLQRALRNWGKVITGFDHPEAVLTGVETRSSAPLRIVRNELMESNIEGLYPAGEGAGYAGGIVSAAVDGLKAAEAVIQKYAPSHNS